MAVYFACLDSNNVIKNTVNVDDSAVAYDRDPAGEVYCQNLFGTGPNGNWVSYKQSSKAHPIAFRYNGAEKHGSYDPTNDAFIPIKPYELWILNENYKWKAPINYPTHGRNGHEFEPGELGDGIEWSDSEATWLNVLPGLPSLKWDVPTLDWVNL